MSVLWLAPQLILMGLCEAFNMIGQIEFFNRQFPEHMRSVGNATFFCSFAASNYVSAIIVTVVHRVTKTKEHKDWLTNNINEGRLDYFYYLIAGIAALNIVYFVIVARRFRYKEEEFLDIHQHDRHCDDDDNDDCKVKGDDDVELATHHKG